MIEIYLKPSVLGELWGFPITNAFIVAVTVSLLLIGVFSITAKRLKLVPGKLQLLLEVFLTTCYSFVESILKDEKNTKRMFPFFATLFIFFLTANLLGFLPGLSAISFNNLPLYRSATSSYALIFAITMVMFIALQITTIASAGIFGYLKQFLNFSSPINFIMGLLNIVGELGKIVSISFRLFGNVFAGEVIATVMLSLAPYVAPVPFAMLGLLSSVIQALVFPLLVVIYFSMGLAVREEREKDRAEKTAKQNTTSAHGIAN